MSWGLDSFSFVQKGFPCTIPKLATDLCTVPRSVNNRDKQWGDGAKGVRLSHGQSPTVRYTWEQGMCPHPEPHAHEHTNGSERSSGKETVFILLNPEIPKLV